MQRSSSRLFPKTPPPPPGMKSIEQWAVVKFTKDIARLKKSVIVEAIAEKAEEEEAAAAKKAKEVRPGRYCPPRQPPHHRSSCLQFCQPCHPRISDPRVLSYRASHELASSICLARLILPTTSFSTSSTFIACRQNHPSMNTIPVISQI